MIDDTPKPPEDETPAPEEETPAPEEETSAPDEDAPSPPEAPEEQPAAKRAPKKAEKDKKGEPEVIPGADLEPDLVLDASAQERTDAAPETDGADEHTAAEGGDGEPQEPEPVVASVLELAADARYLATGKRKRAVARVTLKPGKGEYTINGRGLNEFFPRPTLQRTARGPLETAGQQERLDVVAKIHGGGVSSQAGALRHGIARALVEADPALRGELKRRGFLTRDPRVKERKKAGLKKARKRPQFSKR